MTHHHVCKYYYHQLQKEKVDIENALEQEQEYMVNRLQKQLDLLRQQQCSSPSFSSRVSDPSLSLPVSPAITGIGSSPSFGYTILFNQFSKSIYYKPYFSCLLEQRNGITLLLITHNKTMSCQHQA